MQIIALGHRRRVGKDTLGRFLVTELKLRTKNLLITKAGFADKLKDTAHDLYSWANIQDGQYYECNPEQKEIILSALSKSPRQIWIELGNKIRDIYSDTWIDLLLHKKYCDILVITDLRYLNEVQKIKQLGGLCIKINRTDAPISNDIADNALNSYKGWDYIVDNNGDLNLLNSEALKLMDKLNLGS